MITAVKNKETLFLSIIFVLSFLARFLDLGYSHFYGDETKTFYLDKTIPATTFLLDQRKGPLQFVVVWITEKFIGGYSEFFTRIPFALAGFLAVIVFYLLLKKLFSDTRIVLLSTILFSFNGFNIAFSRTVQYQSFLVLFGLLSVLFGVYACKTLKPKLGTLYLLLSSLSLGMAVYAHYDAVFYFIPLLFFLAISLRTKKHIWKKVILYFLIPLFVLLSVFYVPYFFGGHFNANTFGYLLRRFIGQDLAQNNSQYTYIVYNPSLLFLLILLFSVVAVLKKSKDSTILMFIAWFGVPFGLFQGIISNPGTHIQNYFLPLYVLSAVGIVYLFDLLKKQKNSKLIFIYGMSLFIGYLVVVMFVTYIPRLNFGYPWNSNLNKKYHLFIYGFPYNRGWDQLSIYFKTLKGVRGVYTNDNDVVAQYYLRGFNYTMPGTHFLPQYYIHIENNMEFVEYTPKMLNAFSDFSTASYPNSFAIFYDMQKEFFVDGVKTATVYKLKGK